MIIQLIIIMTIFVTHDSLQNLTYAFDKDTLEVWWENYWDPESGVKEYELSLLKANSCLEEDLINLTTVVESVKVNTTVDSYMFVQLDMKVSSRE